jgi:twitching motility protein PilT
LAFDIQELMQAAVDQGASDLHCSVGRPPVIRMQGGLKEIGDVALTPEDTEQLVRSLTPEKHMEELLAEGTTDYAHAFGDAARFRVSALMQRGNFGLVMRQIPSKLLTFDQIGLPPRIRELLSRPRGLVLVTGPTGSGKTTTLATMIDLDQRATSRSPHHHDRGPDRVLPPAQEEPGHAARSGEDVAETSPRRCAACCVRTPT